MLLVTGSCGAIGRAILPHLARALGRQDGPLPLVLAARDPARVRSLLPGLLQRGARLARLDLEEPGDFRRLEALPVSGVLHLAGLTRTGSARQIQESNLEGTRRLAHAARQAGAERLIFISTPMVDTSSTSQFVTSKRLAEAALQDAGVPCTILRPALVMAPAMPGVKSGFHTLLKLSRFPLLPLPGEGDLVLKPLFAGDLADVILRCLQLPPGREAWSIAGAPVSLEQLFREIAARTGRHPRMVRVPRQVFHAALGALQVMADRRRAPWPSVLSLTYQGQIPSFGSIPKLGLEPTPFSRALDHCLPGMTS